MFPAQVTASCPCLLNPLSLAAVQPVCMRVESFWEATFTPRMLALGLPCGGVSGIPFCFSFNFEIVSLEASWWVRSSTSSVFFVVLAVRVLAGRLDVEALGGIWDVGRGWGKDRFVDQDLN
jgi:hypothetical protein